MAALTRNKIYALVIGILLLSNLALVALFVLNKQEKKEVRRDRPGSQMRESLEKEVGFNGDQMARFDEMVKEHRSMMKPMFEDIGKTKENFYSLLTRPSTPDTVLNGAAKEIGDKQKLIDLKIFTHFQNIRDLCTASQRPAFDSLLQRVVHRMVFPMRKGEAKKDSSHLKK